MKRAFFILCCMALAFAALALARERASSAPQPTGLPAAGVAVESIAPLYEMVKGYIIAAAEQMPEDHYGYQPTPEVRTFGQLIGHVAMAQYWFCNGATGMDQEPGNWEELTSKAELVEVIKGAFEYCAGAYDMDDEMAATNYGRVVKERNIPMLKNISTTLIGLIGLAEVLVILF